MSQSLNLTNGSQLINVAGGEEGESKLALTCATYPTAGTVSVEWRIFGGSVWRPIPSAIALRFSGELIIPIPSGAAQLRVTFASLTGGTNCRAWWTASPADFNAVLDFVQARCYQGQVFETAASFNLAAGASRDTIIEVGALPLSVIGRSIAFNGTRIESRLYMTPTFSGGTVSPYFNLNSRNPATGLTVLRDSPTVTVVGTEIAAPKVILGVTPAGQRTEATLASPDALRVLKANTKYLLRTTNPTAAAMDVTTYSLWHEGE